MRSFEKAVERFCYKHPRFGIDRLMLYIIGGNVAVYLISMMDTTGTFLDYLYFSPQLILRGEVWRLISFVFIPSASGFLWVALTLYFYYFIGSTLEHYWGSGKFTIYYLCGIAATIIFGFAMYACGYRDPYFFFFDAYYVNMSLFFAFAALFPETMVLLFFFIPVKVKWLAYADAAYFAFKIISGFPIFPLNLLPAVAILNFLLFFAGELLDRIKRRRAYKASPNVVNFRKAARHAEYEESHREYRHKCSVCGKTDTEHPELEFRYCSRCAGYHCFCQDHINSHIHFTE